MLPMYNFSSDSITEVIYALKVVGYPIVMIVSSQYLIQLLIICASDSIRIFAISLCTSLHFFANFFLLVFLFTLNFPFLLLEQ